jgi:hypothetical protein
MTAGLLIRWLALTLSTAAQFAIVAAVAGEIVLLMRDIAKGDDYWVID